MKKLALIASSLLLGASLASAAVYKVDGAHSEVGFKVKHLMVSNVNGKFTDFSGEYDLAGGVFKSLTGVIQADSIDTGNENRDDHLRNADFFDVEKYPEIKFVMTSATKKEMTGNLTMHGVTKKVTLKIDMGGEVKGMRGEMRSGFTLSGKLSRKDFGLTWNKALEAGGVAVGDEIRLNIEIEGIAK